MNRGTASFLAFALLSFAQSAAAQGAAAQSASAPLCQQTWEDFQVKLGQRENRLTFTNIGGPMGIGVCWWHSRMQRNALYLLDFHPDQPRLTKDEAWEKITNLSDPNFVQSVNGFANLMDFSSAYSAEMKEYLGQWQMAESFLEFNWVNGLRGDSEADPEELKDIMDELFTQVKGNGEVVYQMLQVPGPVAHAWLVYDMTKTDDGYELSVVDSNFLEPQKYSYRYGQTKFSGRIGSWVPHTQRRSDLKSIRKNVKRVCDAWGTDTGLTALK